MPWGETVPGNAQPPFYPRVCSVVAGALTPLLSNILLNELDRELERRGHCFVRYADDANVYVHSLKAGQRVMAVLRRLYDRLRLQVNESKSAIAGALNGYADDSGPSSSNNGKPEGERTVNCANLEQALTWQRR